jgi:hypothetical protein
VLRASHRCPTGEPGRAGGSLSGRRRPGAAREIRSRRGPGSSTHLRVAAPERSSASGCCVGARFRRQARCLPGLATSARLRRHAASAGQAEESWSTPPSGGRPLDRLRLRRPGEAVRSSRRRRRARADR